MKERDKKSVNARTRRHCPRTKARMAYLNDLRRYSDGVYLQVQPAHYGNESSLAHERPDCSFSLHGD